MAGEHWIWKPIILPELGGPRMLPCRERTIETNTPTFRPCRSRLPMPHPRPLLFALTAALIGSNAWWAYHAVDAGITRTYADISATETRQALAQTQALVRTMAKGSYTKQTLIDAARQPVPEIEPFEKDGFIWIGQIGLKFDAAGTFLQLNEHADDTLPR